MNNNITSGTDQNCSYRLDIDEQRLWLGEQEIQLTPKAFALLYYLVQNQGRLLTKQELLDQVWPNRIVVESSLKAYIKTLRQLLADDAKTPRFIETSRGRGYRFIGTIGISNAPVQTKSETELSTQASTFVGRTSELTGLNSCLEQVLAGVRNVVFISGEAGIGKTTLLDTFVKRLAADNTIWVVRGQCIEQFDAGHALLPLLAAIEELCSIGGKSVIECLSRYAPSWLLQLPWDISDDQIQTLQRKVVASGQERMLREIAQAIEQLTRQHTLILVLEDLHWSDYSTLAVISYLARRRQPARLLLLATFRADSVAVQDHPVRTTCNELLMHNLAAEIPLPLLDKTATSDYLAARFPGHQFPKVLLDHLFEHSEGNPLFMVNILADWIRQKIILSTDGHWRMSQQLGLRDTQIPASLSQLIDYQIDCLSADEQQLIATASVVGVEFSVAVVAAGQQETSQRIEQHCERLARHGQFLCPASKQQWPDGGIATRYRFSHTLYQQVAYQRIAAGRRVILHQRVGECIEQAFRFHLAEFAVELARHFSASEDAERALIYCQQAAELSFRQHAQREAIAHLKKALTWLDKQADTPARKGREVGLQLMLGLSQATLYGFASSDC